MNGHVLLMSLLLASAPLAPALEIASASFSPDDFAMPWEFGGGDNIGVVERDGNHHLEIAIRTHNHTTQVSSVLPIDPSWTRLGVQLRMRASGMQTGSESWQNGRLAIHFLDADGKLLYYGRMPHLNADTDWVPLGADMDIPKGSVQLQIVCAHFGVGGVIAFDDVHIHSDPHLEASQVEDGMAADFERLDDAGRPLGWFMESQRQTTVLEDGNRFLRLVAGGEEARTHIALPAGEQRIRIGCRVRGSDLVGGGSPEQTARLDYEFLSSDGRTVAHGQRVPSLAKDADWHEQSVEVDVPEQAASLLFRVSNRASAGTFDLDDIRIEALNE